jgi:hypothetical protein
VEWITNGGLWNGPLIRRILNWLCVAAALSFITYTYQLLHIVIMWEISDGLESLSKSLKAMP